MLNVIELPARGKPAAHVLRHRAFPIVIVGHVDHGKSTLVGRLLHETGSLPVGKVEQLRTVSAKRGLEFEWSFLLDALQVERDQGITVDTTQIWFHTARRRYVIIDAPGHKEFLKNMITGAAQADAAVLVVDAQAGLAEQTRRHAYLLQLLGLRQVVVAVNKIDLIGHDAARFAGVAAEVGDYLRGLGLTPGAIVPVSAREGDNIAARGERLGWYAGPTLLGALDGFAERPGAEALSLRLPVQDLYRLDDRRVIVGRIESGRLAVGQRLCFTPGGREARVAGLEAWTGPGTGSGTGPGTGSGTGSGAGSGAGAAAAPAPQSATAGESVAFTLDEDVFVERGAMASAAADGGPGAAADGGTADGRPQEASRLLVRLFWLDGESLLVGQRLGLKLGTAEVDAVVEAIEEVIDVETLAPAPADHVARNGVARVVLRTRRPVAVDAYAALPRTGRGVLTRNFHIVAGFVVEQAGPGAEVSPVPAEVTRVDASVSALERARLNGHRGGVLWLTGLSAAGKSTLAMAAMRRLQDAGRQVYVLDGDNLRHGLNADLGFTPQDRAENIRRLAEVARLLADAGLITLVAAISPARADRDRARQIIGAGFREVHVAADLATCQARDPKGLYKRAINGEIANFTGISAPYEIPHNPELTVDTGKLDPARAADRLLEYIEANFIGV